MSEDYKEHFKYLAKLVPELKDLRLESQNDPFAIFRATEFWEELYLAFKDRFIAETTTHIEGDKP